MYAIFSTLDSSRHHELPSVGGLDQCGAAFETQESATAFAAQLVREFWQEPDIGILPDAELLELFQDSLYGTEYFHIYPLAAVPAQV